MSQIACVSNGLSPARFGPAGNVYDKYRSRNPVEQWVVRRFLRTLLDLVRKSGAKSVLEVGCGEGYIAQFITAELPGAQVVACDVSASIVSHLNASYPDVQPFVADATRLPLAEATFDLVLAIEVLEHVPDPEALLWELTRVSRGSLIVSVPWEPWWRLLNVARGRYLRQLGNTPGHIQHWGKQDFLAFLEAGCTIRDVRTPFPWLMCLATPGSSGVR